MTNLNEVFRLAVKHVGNGAEMESSARICLSTARELEEIEAIDDARRWAIKSLRYSVGILHPDYARASR